jgi:thermostable 8-oxoguanine DNA glycosylase
MKINFDEKMLLMKYQKIEDFFDSFYESTKLKYQSKEKDFERILEERIEESKANRKTNFYKRLVLSIHNANWKAASQTTFWDRRVANYEEALLNFDYRKVKDLDLIDLKDKGLIDSEKKLYSCIYAAKFLFDLEQRHGGALQFFDKFAYEGASPYERWALVCIVSQSIKGIGTALACDFLKEIGYLNIGKPDVHINRFFENPVFDNLKKELISDKTNFLNFQIMDKLSQMIGKTVFEIDKIIWYNATEFDDETGYTLR